MLVSYVLSTHAIPFDCFRIVCSDIFLKTYFYSRPIEHFLSFCLQMSDVVNVAVLSTQRKAKPRAANSLKTDSHALYELTP